MVYNSLWLIMVYINLRFLRIFCAELKSLGFPLLNNKTVCWTAAWHLAKFSNFSKAVKLSGQNFPWGCYLKKSKKNQSSGIWYKVREFLQRVPLCVSSYTVLSADHLGSRASKTSVCFWRGIAVLVYKKAFSCVLMSCMSPSADPVGNLAFA